MAQWVGNALDRSSRKKLDTARIVPMVDQSERQSVQGRSFPPTCRFITASNPPGSVAGVAVMMPYLHWDTNSNREALSRIIGTETAKHKIRIKEMARQDREHRRTLRSGLPSLSSPKVSHLPAEEVPLLVQRLVPALPPLMPTWSSILNDAFRFLTNSPWERMIERERTGRLTTRSTLGQFLLDAARLYSVMATFPDRKMLEKYLFSDNPLHPRRTLDQSYNWAMEVTRARDRDQVVFRATKHKLEDRHRLRENYTVPRRRWKAGDEPEPPNWVWDGHTDFDGDSMCTVCTDTSRQTPRVVMVDQLWMYIIDQDTLLTFFPARYGVDELNDPSGAGSTIRQILRTNTDLRSVFDLALVVLEESSMSLLDR